MSLVLKRIVAAYGYQVEQTGVPHRAAFVHWNTGITELEYFGQGRWLVMSQNATPHLIGADPQLRTGGSLKDGWSFLMPHVPGHLEDEVSVAFSDEEWDDHVREQAVALKSLYLSSSTDQLSEVDNENQLSVEQEETAKDKQERVKHFVVKRGHQVVGVATYSEDTGRLFDVAVRPSAGPLAANSLFAAVKQHQRKLGRSGSLLVQPRTAESKQLFEAVGFEELSGDETSGHMELKHF
jgi:N-acetylglutamate synthase-like GNAT family acetyltransferase